jgi:predicted MFS family arabinose efflux permease
MLFTALAHTFWHLVLARAITGLGIGAMLASLTAITAEFSPKKYRGMTVIIVVAGYPLGATAGGFIAAPLMTIYGWESIFLLAGSMTIIMLAIVYFFMPESIQFLSIKQPANALEKINRTLLRIRKPCVEKLPESRAEVSVNQASVLGLLGKQYRKNTVVLWCSVFLCLMCLYFLLSWIPGLVIISGFSEAEGIYASVAFTAGGVIGTVILGVLTSRMGLTNVISVFLILSASTLCVYAYYSDHLNLLYSLAVIGFLFTSGYSGLYAVAARIYPVEIRATGVGWAVGVSRLGAVVGPYIGGILITNEVSLEDNFIITAVPILLAGIMISRLRLQ